MIDLLVEVGFIATFTQLRGQAPHLPRSADSAARTAGELERAAGVTRSTAGKYRRTFMAEEATAAQAAQ